MANREACEIIIEQEIKEGLAQGKKPWAIGKELSRWLEKKFEATINPNTLRMRAERISEKDCKNVQKKSNPIESVTYSPPPIIENRKPQGGGEREGAGRPKIEPISHAIEIASIAISQLDRIQDDDKEKTNALNQVIEYCEARKENKR